MKTYKNEIEKMEKVIAELENANFDLEWDLRVAEKAIAHRDSYLRLVDEKTEPTKKSVKTEKIEKVATERDAYGCRVGTLRAELNGFVTELINLEKFGTITAKRLAKIANEKYTVARWAQHLNWMKSYSWI